MTKSVTNLLTARERRQRDAYHFDTAVDALRFLLDRLNALDDYAGGALLLDSTEVRRHLEQLAPLARACIAAHYRHRDEREEQ